MRTRKLISIVSLTTIGGTLLLIGTLRIVNSQATPPDPVASAVASDSAEVSKVQAAATEAVFAADQAGAPQSQWTTSALSAVPVKGVALQNPPARPTATELQAIKTANTQRLNRVFAHDPARLKIELRGLDNVLNSQRSPNFRYFGSGISNLNVVKTTVSQNSAVTTVKERSWSHFAQKNPDGKYQEALPVGNTTWTIQLAKFKGNWAVTDANWAFDPGSEP